MSLEEFEGDDRLFYEDEVYLPEIEDIVAPYDSRPVRTSKIVEAVKEYLRRKDMLRHVQVSKQELYRTALRDVRYIDWERMRDTSQKTASGSMYCSICSEAQTTQIGFSTITTDQFRVEAGNFTVIKHRHYSTLDLNKNKVVDQDGKIYCLFCKISSKPKKTFLKNFRY